MKLRKRPTTCSLLKLGTFTLLLVTAGFATLPGCSTSGEPRFEAPPTLAEHEGPSKQQTSVLVNHKQSTLYQHMLMQGNYSDAAILKSFQHIQPLQAPPSSLFTDISAPLIVQASITNTRNPSHTQGLTPQLSANWHARVGWMLVLDGNYRGAEAAYRQALRKNPKSAKANLGLGMALNLQGDRQKAISAYEKAIAIQPNYAAALVHLGYAYTEGDTKGQNIAKARTLFKQASELGDPFAMLALLDIQTRKPSV